MGSHNSASPASSSQKHLEKFQTLLLLDFMHGFLQNNISDPASTLDYYSDTACAGSLLGDKYFKKPFNSKNELVKLLTSNEKVKNSYSQMRYCISNVERRVSDNLIILQVQGVLFQADQPQLGSRDFIRLLHFKHVKEDFFEITYDSISIVEVLKTASLPTKDNSEDIYAGERDKLSKSISNIEIDLEKNNEKLVSFEEELAAKKKSIEDKRKLLQELKNTVAALETKVATEKKNGPVLGKEADLSNLKKTQVSSDSSSPAAKPTLTDRTAEFSNLPSQGNTNKSKQPSVLIDKTGSFRSSSPTASQSGVPLTGKNKKNASKEQSQKNNNKSNNNDLAHNAIGTSPQLSANGDKKDELSKSSDSEKQKKEQLVLEEQDDDDEWEIVGKSSNSKDNSKNKKGNQRHESDFNGYRKKKNNGGDVNKQKSGMNKKNY